MLVLSIITWILSALLAAMMLMAGGMKLLKRHADLPMATLTERSAATVKLIGVAEVLGAVGLILPPLVGVLPWLAAAASFALAAIQVLAVFAHRRLGEPFRTNIVLAAVSAAIGVLWLVVL